MKYTFFFLILIIFSTACEEKEETSDMLPNIILLMGDDHGWEETGYNGHPFVQTPVLDDMAREGLRLDRFHSASPVCSPTRMSVLTGRHPNRSGTFVPNYSIRPEEITIAHLLKTKGYVSGHFGKWHLGPVKKTSPTNPGAMGFDEWLSHDNFFELDPPLSRNGAPPQILQGESSAVLVDETIKFIKKSQQKQQPFFAVIWFGSPHEPYQGLAEDVALYDNLPENLKDSMVTLTSLETGTPAERSLFEVLQERYAEITAMDRAIGLLRNYLLDNKLKDNTILWYCGDNGIPASGHYASNLRGRKGTIYEGGTRVPAIIEWPKEISQPTISTENSVTSDILPTICDITDIPLPSRPLDGTSVRPFWQKEHFTRSNPIYFWSYNTKWETSKERAPYIDSALQEGTTPLVKMMNGKYTRSFRNYLHPEIDTADYSGNCAVLDENYRLVVQMTDDEKKVELFDITKDPAEKRDISQEYPEVVTQIQLNLRDWQTSVLRSLTRADYSQGE